MIVYKVMIVLLLLLIVFALNSISDHLRDINESIGRTYWAVHDLNPGWSQRK